PARAPDGHPVNADPCPFRSFYAAVAAGADKSRAQAAPEAAPTPPAAEKERKGQGSALTGWPSGARAGAQITEPDRDHQQQRQQAEQEIGRLRKALFLVRV